MHVRHMPKSQKQTRVVRPRMTEVIQVRVCPEEKSWFEAVAARDGIKASTWLRMRAIAAAREAAPDGEPELTRIELPRRDK